MSTAPEPSRGYIPQLPEGWVKCPKFGDPRFFEGLNIIPCKVPLSTKFNNLVGPSGRWTLVDAIRQFRSYGMDVATIIDLTKSRNYYDINREMEELCNPPIHYVKIACRGRGQSPLPSEVNEAVWQIFSHHIHVKDKYILLHCTHGFNRTGYIVVAALLRLRHMTVKRAVARFAQARPPGIYKDGYINDLFTYYHEGRDLKLSPTPPVPPWKGNDNAEDAADAANEDQEGEEKGARGELPAEVTSHEDIWSIGETVCEDEANWVREQVCGLLGSAKGPNMRFPGMQPVSLLMDRLRDLRTFRYHITWKADGTRYMVFIMPQGTYIMDRSFNVVRCQMRFVRGLHRPHPGCKNLYPVGKPLTCTLLDGEMVLDVDPSGQQPPRLRYLIYDVCMINGDPLLTKPWKDRYRGIESDIVGPRNVERKYIERWRNMPFDATRAEYQNPPLAYDYVAERFSVRRKDFWPAFHIDKVFERFKNAHKIGHESDGLILQGYEDKYVSGTCERLYKWKFAHMNSVDFLLRCAKRIGPSGQPKVDPDGQPEPLQLFLLDQNVSRGRGITYIPLAEVDKDGDYRVEFPPDVDPLMYDGKLVECNFDHNRRIWMFMRERKDKDTPNASRVYLRIKESIINHVDQELLVGTLKEALMFSDVYSGDRNNMNPKQQADMQKEVEAWRERRAALEATRRSALSSRPYNSEDEEPVSPPPASPPPPGYFDGTGDVQDDDFHAYGMNDDADGGGGGGGDYKASEADVDADVYGDIGEPLKRRRGAGGGEGQEQEQELEQEQEQEQEGRPKRRRTRWDFDVDEPYPGCPVYEGYGFD